MTNEDRQILIDNCEVLKQLLQCQLDQDHAWRALSQALKRHFPNLEAEYRQAQKDSIFESQSTVAIHKLQLKIDGIVERLKRFPPSNA